MPPPENSKRTFVRQYTDSFSKIDWGSLGGSTRRSIPRQQLPRDFSVGSIDIPSMGDEGGVGVASSGGEKKKGLKDHFKQQQRLSVISSFSCHEDIVEDGQRIDGEKSAARIGTEKSVTRESKSTSSSSAAWCLVLTVVLTVMGAAEYFITFPPSTAILYWEKAMSGDKEQGVFDDTAQEMLELAEQITAACGESSRSSTGTSSSSCQELCHNHMCCVEQDDEYSCKGDVMKDCAVYAGCMALIDDSYFGER